MIKIMTSLIIILIILCLITLFEIIHNDEIFFIENKNFKVNTNLIRPNYPNIIEIFDNFLNNQDDNFLNNQDDNFRNDRNDQNDNYLNNQNDNLNNNRNIQNNNFINRDNRNIQNNFINRNNRNIQNNDNYQNNQNDDYFYEIDNIVNEIENEFGLNGFLRNIVINNNQNGNLRIYNPIVNNNFVNNINPFTPIINNHKSPEEILNTAERNSENKNEITETFFKEARVVRSDTQNAHDSHVVNQSKNELNKIINENKKFICNPNITNIRRYANMSDDIDIKSKSEIIMSVLNLIEKNNRIETFNMGEKDILLEIWKRSEDPKNKNNEKNIKDAICKALYDINEGIGGNVCITGRTERIINSLAGLDYDNNIGKIMTTEMYKNEIFNLVKKMFDKEINDAIKSNNEEIQNIGLSYNDPKIEVDEVIQNKFINEIKNKISFEIDNEFKDKDIRDFEKIKNDALMGII